MQKIHFSCQADEKIGLAINVPGRLTIGHVVIEKKRNNLNVSFLSVELVPIWK